MKRHLFLGGSAAVALAGCGGHAVRGGLPPLAAATPGAATARRTPANIVPQVADPIPPNVLANPIVGEARRFDGATAPPMWMFARGQSLDVATYPALFGVLGTIAGGDGKKTFALPNPTAGWIVAVTGNAPASPRALASVHRAMFAHGDGLGQGATPRPPAIPQPPHPDVVAARRLLDASPRVGRPRVESLSYETIASISTARETARASASAALSDATRATLLAAVDDVVAGRRSFGDATDRMTRALTRSEADALLAAHDAMSRPFRSGASDVAHGDAPREAARFLISIAFSREQTRAALANRPQ